MTDIPLKEQLYGFVDDLERSIREEFDLDIDCDDIILCGVGGSAVSGDFSADCCYIDSTKPVVSVKYPHLPHWAGPRTLAVISSYSGNTAETLHMREEAKARGCTIVNVTSGGRLMELSEENGEHLIPLPKGMQPRHAVGYMIGYTLGVIRSAGGPDLSGRILDFIPSLRRFRDENTLSDGCLAKELAAGLMGHVPVVCADACMRSVAYRWKTQFNENTKYVAFCDSELGFGTPALDIWCGSPQGDAIPVLLIGCDDPMCDNADALDKAAHRLEEAGAPHIAVRLGGASTLENMFRALILGDYISMYMALIRGIDPAEVRPVMQLKAKLAADRDLRSRQSRDGFLELVLELGRALLRDRRIPGLGVDSVLRFRARGSEEDPSVVVEELEAVRGVHPVVRMLRCYQLGDPVLQLFGAFHGLLYRAVGRERVHLLPDAALLHEAFEHDRGAHGAVPAELMVGEYQPTVLLPSEDRSVGGHLAGHDG